MPFEIAQPQVEVTVLKPSQHIRRGFAMVNGAQCTKDYCSGNSKAPVAVCVLGAFHLSRCGDAEGDEDSLADQWRLEIAFDQSYGIDPQTLNDDGKPWPEIVAMVEAIGL